MRAKIRTAILAMIALAVSSPSVVRAGWPPAEGRGACAVTKQTDVEAKMRDGVILRADVYRPTTSQPVPVILMRTQYGKAAAQVQPARFQSPEWFASHCYLVVIQDIRGQGASDGVFYEYAHDRDDGYDRSSGPRACRAPTARWGCTARPTSARPSGWRPPRRRRI